MGQLTFSTAVRNTVYTFSCLKAKLHIWRKHIVLTPLQIPEPNYTEKKRLLTILSLLNVSWKRVNGIQ